MKSRSYLRSVKSEHKVKDTDWEQFWSSRNGQYCTSWNYSLHENFTNFTVRANQWKFHSYKMNFFNRNIGKNIAQSVKISCSEKTCTLKSVKLSCSENFMNCSIVNWGGCYIHDRCRLFSLTLCQCLYQSIIVRQTRCPLTSSWLYNWEQFCKCIHWLLDNVTLYYEQSCQWVTRSSVIKPLWSVHHYKLVHSTHFCIIPPVTSLHTPQYITPHTTYRSLIYHSISYHTTYRNSYTIAYHTTHHIPVTHTPQHISFHTPYQSLIHHSISYHTPVTHVPQHITPHTTYRSLIHHSISHHTPHTGHSYTTAYIIPHTTHRSLIHHSISHHTPHTGHSYTTAYHTPYHIPVTHTP